MTVPPFEPLVNARGRRSLPGVVGFAGVVEPVTGDTERRELVEGELVREAAWALREYDRTRSAEWLGRCFGALEAVKLLRADRG